MTQPAAASCKQHLAPDQALRHRIMTVAMVVTLWMGCASAVSAVTVAEFYNSILDHYFITADAN